MKRIDRLNTSFLIAAHILAVLGIGYSIFVHFAWQTLVLAGIWSWCCSVSITGGYHRLFAHPTYNCSRPLKLFYLLFGAASVQNSALKWASDHRWHHANTDEDADPYNIKRGFWWAHIGWIVFKTRTPDLSNVPDLKSDPLVRFQHRFYISLAILFGAAIPAAIGLIWGDPVGAFLWAGFIRLIVQYHSTFSVNSVAHSIGRQPYSKGDSARDSFWTALVTMGEGYHNFHHRFPADYRNGVRWYHFDPTKWWVRSLSWVGLTRNLRKVPREAIVRAKREMASVR